jgi:hypothetical protein
MPDASGLLKGSPNELTLNCHRFLYADPTPAALQVFLNSDTPAAKQVADLSLALPPEQGNLLPKFPSRNFNSRKTFSQ